MSARNFLLATAAVIASITLAFVALFPSEREITEIRVRAANLEQVIQILETTQRRGALDEALDDRLFEAYEATGRRQVALQELSRRGRLRPLTVRERQRVRELALADGKAAKALPVLEGPHETLSPARRRELVELSLAAGRPRDAWRHQAALSLALPAHAPTWARRRDLALAVNEQADAVTAQRHVATLEGTEAAARRLADVQVGARDLAGALATLEAIQNPADPLDLHRSAAKVAEWANLPGRAIPHWWELYKASPSAELGHKLLFAAAARRDQRAVPLAQELLDRYPGEARLAADCRSVLLSNGRVAAVRDALAAAIGRAPDDPTAHRALVDFALAQSSRDVALKELERWLGRHQDDRAARHQLAVVTVWDGRAQDGWDVYASLFTDGKAGADPTDTLERKWREEWLALSRSVEDFTPQGIGNLQALLAGTPGRTDLRRRLAAAQMEAGDAADAIASQRRVASSQDAKAADVLQLAEWLGWYGQAPEALALMRALDARAPLPLAALDDAIQLASTERRWDDAAYFLGRKAMLKPGDQATWTSLALARQTLGDRTGAAEALYEQARHANSPRAWVAAAEAHLRAQQPAAALADLEAAGPQAGLAAMRWRAQLATRLGPPQREERAWHAVVQLAPADVEANSALARLADGRGDVPEGDRRFQALLAARPADEDLLVAAAARWLTREPARAARALAALERLPRPGPDAMRLLADHYQASDANRATGWLDRLHAAGAGDAETYFRRAELATEAGNGELALESFERAAKLGAAAGASPTEREARGYALERLGRPMEARAVWQALVKSAPDRPAAFCQLARLQARDGDAEAAEKLLLKAATLAPRALEVQLARAECLKLAGRSEEASDELASARESHPAEAYLAVSEAMARQDLGQFLRARSVVRQALRQHPGSPDLAEVHRGLRDQGAHQVGTTVAHDAWGSFERLRVTASGRQQLGDRFALTTDVARMHWDGGNARATDIAIGVVTQHPRGEASARFALPVKDGSGPQSPLASLSGTWKPLPAVQLEAKAEEARWEDTNALAATTGREHRVGVRANWRPETAPLALGAEATLGRLEAPNTPADWGNVVAADATWLPDKSGAWWTSYQVRRRAWGQAGSGYGLPTDLTAHRVFGGHAGRLGPVRYEVQPGMSYDSFSGLAPAVEGALTLELGPDAEIGATAGWGANDLVTGTQGNGYHNVEVTGRLYF